MLKTDSAAKNSLSTPFGAFLEKFSKIMDFGQTHEKNADREDYEMNLTVLTYVLRSRVFFVCLSYFSKHISKPNRKI